MAEEAHENDTSADHDSHERADPRMRRKHELRMYARFGAMIATSTTVMFLLTYTNAYAMDHVRFSEERVYMALLMGAAMAIIMLGFIGA